MSICYVPISIGELFDKLSILMIKSYKIKNSDKLININKEILYLKPIVDKYKIDENLFDELIDINKKIWDIEDNIRKKEYIKEFDNRFIELARSIYINNDIRANIKNNINNIFNSDIIEIKDYFQYK
jgi:hypothetical protein